MSSGRGEGAGAVRMGGWVNGEDVPKPAYPGISGVIDVGLAMNGMEGLFSAIMDTRAAPAGAPHTADPAKGVGEKHGANDEMKAIASCVACACECGS